MLKPLYIYRGRRLACGVLIKVIRLLSCYRTKYYLISSLLPTHGEWPFTTTIAHVLRSARLFLCQGFLRSRTTMSNVFPLYVSRQLDLSTRWHIFERKSIERSCSQLCSSTARASLVTLSVNRKWNYERRERTDDCDCKRKAVLMIPGRFFTYFQWFSSCFVGTELLCSYRDYVGTIGRFQLL